MKKALCLMVILLLTISTFASIIPVQATTGVNIEFVQPTYAYKGDTKQIEVKVTNTGTETIDNLWLGLDLVRKDTQDNETDVPISSVGREQELYSFSFPEKVDRINVQMMVEFFDVWNVGGYGAIRVYWTPSGGSATQKGSDIIVSQSETTFTVKNLLTDMAVGSAGTLEIKANVVSNSLILSTGLKTDWAVVTTYRTVETTKTPIIPTGASNYGGFNFGIQQGSSLGIGATEKFAATYAFSSSNAYGYNYDFGAYYWDIAVWKGGYPGSGASAISRIQKQFTIVYKFDMTVSIQWDVETAQDIEKGSNFINQLVVGLRKASDYLFDISDGQMCFGRFSIYDNQEHWNDANNIRIFDDTELNPNTTPDFLWFTDPHIQIGRKWTGNFQRWDEGDIPIASRIVIHEFGHLMFGLQDEYYSNLFKFKIDKISDAECTDQFNQKWYDQGRPAGNSKQGDQNDMASIMDTEFEGSELCNPTNHDFNKNTAQENVNHESTWSTVHKLFNWAYIPMVTNPGPNENVGKDISFISTFLPAPAISSVNHNTIANLGDPVEIEVKCTNNGATAAWQTIALSFPKDQALPTGVMILSSDLNSFTTYSPGRMVSSGYGTETSLLVTYLVEGATSNWQNAEVHNLKIRVTPSATGSFVFYVKSIAALIDAASNWDPTREYSIPPTLDQQNEYVELHTIQITDSGLQGGPDSFGYTFKDSMTTSGPSYNWVEISGSGTQVLPSSDDSWASNINLGFFFNYYGTDYSQVSIGNNGLLFSGTASSKYVNQPITQTSDLHGFIAPFWDDLVTWGTAGTVYYQTLGSFPNRQFVTEWYDNQHYYSSASGATFEAILYEGTNNIEFQYKDVSFGTVSSAVNGDNPPYDNGGSATVGIENPAGNIGLQYSYNTQAITPGLAILFKFPQFSGTNMHVSINAPSSMDHGNTMSYTLYYRNFGITAAQNVKLQATLSPNVAFTSASSGGTYDSTTRTVTWNIGAMSAFPSGIGSATITVTIPASVTVGTSIQTSASISTSTLETRYDDNTANAQTSVTGSNLPANVGVGPIVGTVGGAPSIYYSTPTTFTYTDSSATSVNIRIHLDDGGSDYLGAMTRGSTSWTYSVTFYPRHAKATVTYTVNYPSSTSQTVFNIYVDPAGYIYNAVTNQRISGASVWLQRPDGQGGWVNVPTGANPNNMIPDTNPLITDISGQYQWNTVPGTYRVHVEAQGYSSADSIIVNVPPPVTDLHVGLTPLPDIPQTRTLPFTDNFASLSGWTGVAGAWSLVSGGVQGSGSSEVMMYTGSTSWTNYQVTANVLAVNNEASLVVRYKDPTDFYFLGLGCWGHKYSISRIVGGVEQELAYSGLANEVDVGRWYLISAIAVDSRLQLFVDGVKVLEVQDSSLPYGAVGVRTWGGTMRAEYLNAQLATAPVQTRTLPFTDNFASLSGWTGVAGAWSLVSGGVQGSGSSEVMMYTGSTSWTNYQVTANVLAVNNEASLVVRYKDSADFYWMGVGCWGHKYSISKVVSGVYEELVSSGLDSEVDVGRWYLISAIAVDDRLQLFVDGVKVLEVQDSSLPYGAVGIRTWAGTMNVEYVNAQSATTPPQTRTLPFTDNFASLSGWTGVAGAWSLVSGGVQGSGSSEVMMYTGSTSWTNYQVTANVLAVNNEASLVVRYKDPTDFYFLGLGCWGHKYSISRIVGGVEQELAYSGLANEVDVGRWYLISAIAVDDRLQLFVDGVKVLEVQDSSLPYGAVGVRTWGGTMRAEYLNAQLATTSPSVPTGSIVVNGGAAFATSTSVTLALTCSDSGSGVNQVRYSNDGVWDTEAWESVSASRAWSLTAGDGSKTVYYQIRDNAGLLSITYSDSIILDTTVPTGSIVVNGGAAFATSTSVTLALTCSDSGSGVNQVRYSNDGVWDTEAWESVSASRAWSLTAGDGSKTVYYQIRDNAGLFSSTYSDEIILQIPPTPTPTASPTSNPTASPTSNPTASPTSNPTASPTSNPTTTPFSSPSQVPLTSPSPVSQKTETPLYIYALAVLAISAISIIIIAIPVIKKVQSTQKK